jgi:hypothetical protein
MRKLLLASLVIAAPMLVAPTSASAWGWGCGSGYGYAPRYYGYSTPRYYGYSYYAPRWRFYGPRVYGYRAGWGVRRWGLGGWRGWRR